VRGGKGAEAMKTPSRWLLATAASLWLAVQAFAAQKAGEEKQTF
jgi:hypothetical protein